ncbi:M23 family metallopeptidase [Treponema pedis]|uniref:M23 family metallopeptidase n=1 Tax=Treponema pedis TaxID=409322 RepID=UPI0004161E99|nr:M23 family metallopeptidase [Treponema pedis]
MPRTRTYKRAENNLVRAFGELFRQCWTGFSDAVLKFIGGGRKKLTIMVVPHSQKKVINFQTSIFSIVFTTVLFIGVIASFFWFTAESIAAAGKLSALKEETRKTQASLNILKEESNSLLKNAKNFQSALSSTLSSLGLQSIMETASEADESSDLSRLFNVKEQAEGSVKEAAELQKLSSYLQDSVQPVQELGKLMSTQAALFSDIPSLWPIRGGIGHISMAFGQNRHPFTGQWYIHTGIDLSTGRKGDPIMATADGQIITVASDSGWGNYILIKHKHGFYTRYAHLDSFRVTVGEQVQKGQVIGYIGNTGISTGPHLHYEVHIGSDVVDPMKYLNIKRTGRNK